jgi:tetratricopeptide (TPR) repeat protein
MQSQPAPIFGGKSADEILSFALQQHEAGQLDAAEASYRQMLRTSPDHPDALHLLGLVLHQLGQHDAAVDSIGRAVALRGDIALFRVNAVPPLLALGRLQQAEEECRAALRLKPDLAEAHGNLGVVLRRLGRAAEAEASYRAALALKPDFLDTLRNYGNLLAAQERFAEAASCFQAALRVQPTHLPSEQALGSALHKLGRLEEAEASCRRALALAPEQPAGHYHLGIVLYGQNRLTDAEASYRAVLRRQPDHQMAHYNLGHILLVTGRLEEGWPETEWQAVTHESGNRPFPVPLWQGEPLAGRTILLHAEQGLGDTAQFCRYAPILARDATVLLEVQPPLRRLMASLPGVTQVFARGEALPRFDLHCPLAFLPRRTGTVLETIPTEIPYLRADPAQVAAWRDRLTPLPGLRIGLVWAGGQGASRPEQLLLDRSRSITLARLAPLAAVPGLSFVSLQKGPPAAQAQHPPAGMALYDFTAELSDFADTAALVEALDLVISVDTAVAHLAGALSKPVWLLNRFDTCWRWLLDRADSPWYPSLRLFRQKVPGDWDGVVADVQAALSARQAGGEVTATVPLHLHAS